MFIVLYLINKIDQKSVDKLVGVFKQNPKLLFRRNFWRNFLGEILVELLDTLFRLLLILANHKNLFGLCSSPPSTFEFFLNSLPDFQPNCPINRSFIVHITPPLFLITRLPILLICLTPDYSVANFLRSLSISAL